MSDLKERSRSPGRVKRLQVPHVGAMNLELDTEMRAMLQDIAKRMTSEAQSFVVNQRNIDAALSAAFGGGR